MEIECGEIAVRWVAEAAPWSTAGNGWKRIQGTKIAKRAVRGREKRFVLREGAEERRTPKRAKVRVGKSRFIPLP
jgi:hypothetical protein